MLQISRENDFNEFVFIFLSDAAHHSEQKKKKIKIVLRHATDFIWAGHSKFNCCQFVVLPKGSTNTNFFN